MPPTRDDPLALPCVVCNGEDEHCPACNGTGEYEVTECPNQWIGSEVHGFARLADLFDKGLPPVAGGALDQTRAFLDAESAWRRDVKLLEAHQNHG